MSTLFAILSAVSNILPESSSFMILLQLATHLATAQPAMQLATVSFHFLKTCLFNQHKYLYRASFNFDLIHNNNEITNI